MSILLKLLLLDFNFQDAFKNQILSDEFKYIHNGKAGMEFASAEGILLMKKTLKKGQ